MLLSWEGKAIDSIVTVISLSYNSNDLIRSINSVLNQSYQNIEYIIIDDGSTNFSQESICEYVTVNKSESIKKFTVLLNKRNMGTVYTLNRAIKASSGKYIFNLGGDDCFHDNNVIADWVDFFNRTGALVSTARMAVYRYDEYLWKQPSEEQIEEIKFFTAEQLFNSIAACNFIFGCCTARSRACIEKYGLFDERYRYIEDHSMNLRLLRNGVKFYFFDRTVVDYSIGGISSPTTYDKLFEKDVKAIFKNEALPYVISKKKAKCDFKRFKKEKRSAFIHHKYSERLKKCGENNVKKVLVKIAHYTVHPIEFFKNVKTKLINEKNISKCEE